MYPLASKRFCVIFGILILAISIGAISKKIISYPTGECIKGVKELTFNKGLNNSVI
tara:strand:- start:496 stop:663 length:168 start_codon:yes stop_codon:yes gene_type:complete